MQTYRPHPHVRCRRRPHATPPRPFSRIERALLAIVLILLAAALLPRTLTSL